jgi:hypothetical protein
MGASVFRIADQRSERLDVNASLRSIKMHILLNDTASHHPTECGAQLDILS